VRASLLRDGSISEDETVITVDPAMSQVGVTGPDGERTLPWPDELALRNVEGVGFDLLHEHPGSIEIAGVILLMAMLGATVLSRKQVEFEEEAKQRQAEALIAAGTVFSDKEVAP
jgi:hypothetical protein